VDHHFLIKLPELTFCYQGTAIRYAFNVLATDGYEVVTKVMFVSEFLKILKEVDISRARELFILTRFPMI
jgi:hypothetical protein